MGCGPSACEKNIAVVHGPPQSSPQRTVLHVGTVAALTNASVRRRGVRDDSQVSSTTDHNSRNARLLHNRRLLALRETLEYELSFQGGDDDETSMQERQVRVDELLAQMMFEEELSSLDLGYFRHNRWQLRAAPRTPEPPAASPGLAPQDIEGASVRKSFKKEEHGSHDEEKTYCYECILCLAEYEDGDELRAFRCDHTFHVACVDEWLKRSKACPLCSEDILAQSAKEVIHLEQSPSHLSQLGHSEAFSLSTATVAPTHSSSALIPPEGVRGSFEHIVHSDIGNAVSSRDDCSDTMDDDAGPASPLPTAPADLEWSLHRLAQLSPSSHPPPVPSTSPAFANPSCLILSPEGPTSLVLVQPSYIDDCQVRFSPISGSSSSSSHECFRADQPQRSCSPLVPSPTHQRNDTEDSETPVYADDESSTGSSPEDMGCSVRLPGEVPRPADALPGCRSFSFGARRAAPLLDAPLFRPLSRCPDAPHRPTSSPLPPATTRCWLEAPEKPPAASGGISKQAFRFPLRPRPATR
eukprot:EG_transcript_5999